MQHEPWTPAQHSAFPAAFRAAARTLLLVAHRGRSARSRNTRAGHAGAALLGALPPGALLHVLAQAAYPLSAWKPALEGGPFMEMYDTLLADFELGLA